MSGTAGLQLYVYYRLPHAALAAAAAAARGLQAELAAAWPGLDCALLRRPEAADGQLTLMEVYRGVPAPGFEAALQAAAARRPALPAQRHVERFVPLD